MLAAVVVVLVLVGGVVAALTLGGSDEEADGGPSTASTSTTEDEGSEEPEPEETDTSAPPEGIESFALPSAFELSEVCDRSRVVEGAQPFPADPRPGDLSAFSLVQNPHLDPPLRGRPEWKLALTPDDAYAVDVPMDGGVLNAVVCVTAVEGTAQVRTTCEGTGEYAGQTWEVWSSEYFFRTIDPLTGAIVDESEPFFSGDLPDSLFQCAAPYDTLSDVIVDPRQDDLPTEVTADLLADYFATLVSG